MLYNFMSWAALSATGTKLPTAVHPYLKTGYPIFIASDRRLIDSFNPSASLRDRVTTPRQRHQGITGAVGLMIIIQRIIPP
ncbi:MAG: hypothetical protein RLZ22_1040 [Verrucomicrobiota bacterium]